MGVVCASTVNREGPALIESSVRTFPHRKKADGTWESICSDCLRTIANVRDMADLDNFERAHHCVQLERPGTRFERPWQPVEL